MLDMPGRTVGTLPKWTWLVLALVIIPLPAAAQQHSHALYQIGAVRVDQAPELDGVMDDAVWESAVVVEDFVQQEPEEGAPASERTEVRIANDGKNLYLGVRAFDGDPAAIVATEMRRDSDRILEEDNFQVILDTFMDSRSGYMFVISPLGAKLDQQVFEEGEGGGRGISNVNRDWDGVWDVAATLTADGWVAEIAIPMITLRFPEAPVQDWGVNFMRNIARKNEQAFWAPIPKAYGLTRVSLAGSLKELTSLSQGRALRIKPFVVGGGRRVLSSGVADNTVQRDMGLDLKYGLTAGLNLDLTFNTDFAQAEVDDERVNLTRFPLFFPEKRDFFLENAGQFTVGTAASNISLGDLFFSRRIGLTRDGEHVPILTGARLTGKAGRNNVAVMDVQTDAAFGLPGENFLVARYSRDVLSRSKVGALVINKQANSGGSFNRTFASDMTLALHPSFSVNGFLARTVTPDASGEEMAGHFRAAWLDRAWNIYAEYTDFQDNFNPEVGFVPRIGIRTSKFHVERNPRPNRFGIRVLRPMVNITYTTDQSSRLVSRRMHYMLGTQFENGAALTFMHNVYFERLDEPYRVRGDVVVPPGGYDFSDWSLQFSTNPSRRVYSGVTFVPQTFYDGERTDLDVQLGVRVNSRLAAEASYSRNDVDMPTRNGVDGNFEIEVGALRIDYALSPNASLRTLTQYNSASHQWSTSARFRFTYRPGSDFYIVYDEVRRDAPTLPEFRDRQLILKLSHLVSR